MYVRLGAALTAALVLLALVPATPALASGDILEAVGAEYLKVGSDPPRSTVVGPLSARSAVRAMRHLQER
jgi:hypothetical protein